VVKRQDNGMLFGFLNDGMA